MKKLDEEIRPAVEQEAEAYLQDIVTFVGIEEATESMRRKMEKRNTEILAAYDSYMHDPARLQSEIRRINDYWLNEITEDAEKCKASGGNCDKMSDKDEVKSDSMVLTIVLSVLGVLSCCCIIASIAKAKKNPANGPAATDGSTLQQGNGEGADGVILGRPAGGGSDDAAAGAAMGMPPTTPGQAAGKDPDAATDANGLVAIGHPVLGQAPDAEKAQAETLG